MGDIDWTSERRLCQRQQAGVVAMPRPDSTGLGAESERKPIIEVMARKWWWNHGGIYTIRDEHGSVLYLGYANAPLGARLRLATMRKPVATWAERDYRNWTVSLRHGSEEDLRTLRATLQPVLMRGGGGPVTVRTVVDDVLERLAAHASRLEGAGQVDAANAVRSVAADFAR